MEEKDYKYMVGVRCFTFNQSRYILDALNGFVMQQTNFPFVIMVVDDASTDGEQEVIAKFISEQFDTTDSSVAYEKETDYAHISYAQHKTNKNCYIAALYLKENHYSQRKTKMPYLSEWRDNVKYEALCEGDDYWIDEMKLQKQVDFMESHEDYGLIHTGFNYLNVDTNKQVFGDEKTKQNLKIINNGDDLILSILDGNKYTIQTVTVLMRKRIYNKALEDLVDYKNLFLMGDTQLWVSIVSRSKIMFFPEPTSVYRLHTGSACHQIDMCKSLRFILSCSEMRVMMAEKFQQPKFVIDKFGQEYKKNLLVYLWFDESYKPFVKIPFSSKVDKIIYRILTFRCVRSLMKYIFKLYRNLVCI